MAIVGDIGVKLWANVRDFVGGIKVAENKLKEFKSVLGKRAFLGEVGEILQGGGAVAGATFLAKMIGEAADKTAVLAAQLRDGTLTMGQFVGESARAIPVFGQYVKMWDSILSLITRSKTAAELVAEGQAKFDLANKVGDTVSRFERAAELSGLQGADRQRAQARFELQDKMSALGDLQRAGGDENAIRAAAAFANAEFVNQMAEIRRSLKAVEDPMQDVIAHLDGQAMQLHMTSGAFAAYEARMKGASDAQAKYIEQQTDSIEKMRKQQTELQASQAAMEAFSRSVFEETRTPMEKYIERMKELDEALKQGAIDAELFNRAQLKALLERDALNSASRTSARTTAEFQQINPSTFSFGALRQLNRTQTVNDPQIQQTNRLLGSIDRKVGNQVALTS